MTEQEIIRLYEGRDETAISETTKKYGSYCNCIVSRILQNKEDVEECVNDTWFSLWNSIPPAKPVSFRAYLAKTARNHAINFYKKTHGKKKITKECETSLEELSECLSNGTSVEKEMEQKELAMAVNLFLKEQSREERLMFLWRYFYLDTVPEIAGRLHLKENVTIQSHANL